MKIALDTQYSGYVINAYEPGRLLINNRPYMKNVLVSPKRVEDWEVTNMDTLASRHLQALTEFKPEIVIIGTGLKQSFPHPSLFIPLMDAGIGYEIMDTAAACRTYNVLIGEDRAVLAALIVASPNT